jgi:transposase
LASQILGDAPRPGAPLKFSAEQVCEIIAVACEQPAAESERPVSHWSRRALADEVKKRGIVSEISPRRVGRFLKQAELQPHRSEYWLHPSPEDPEQLAREVQQVCEGYVHAAALEAQGIHAVSSDEKTAIQAIERRSTPARPQEPSQGGTPGRHGQPEHREHTDRRHGTLALIVSFWVALGKVRLATAGPTRGERDFQQHVEHVVATDPQGGGVFIVDRLNTHDSESLVRYVAAALGDTCELGKKGRRGILKSAASRRGYLSDPEHRIRFVYLPKHSSWLNQVECWFGILVRRLLKRGSFRSVEELKARILAFVEYFNQTMAKPMRWTYTGRPLAQQRAA